MQVAITFRHLDSSDAVKDHVEEKMAKLTRLLSKEPINVHVILSQEKFRYIAEVTVHAMNLSLACVEEASDLYAAIDQVSHKLEHQLRRHKEKLTDRKAYRAELPSAEAFES